MPRRREVDTIACWRGRLPHWEVAGALHFITIHLAGAIPKAAACRIREISKRAKASPVAARGPLQRKVFEEMERWLDRNAGCQYLVIPEVADSVTEAIRCRAGKGIWTVYEHVLLPTHIHLLLEFGSMGMWRCMTGFKRRTGYLAAAVLRLQGKSSWQKEWFDHWVRTPEEAVWIAEYIRQNPVKAGLVSNYRDWRYGSWR